MTVAELDGDEAFISSMNRTAGTVRVRTGSVLTVTGLKTPPHAPLSLASSVLRSAPGSSSSSSSSTFKEMEIPLEVIPPLFTVTIKVGDDLGQVLLLLQHTYGLNDISRGIVAHQFANSIASPDVIGSPDSVRRRRQGGASDWLTAERVNKKAHRRHFEEIDYLPRCSSLSSSSSTSYFSSSSTTTSSSPNLGMESRDVIGPISIKGLVTIVMTTCKRLDNFLSTIEAIKRSVREGLPLVSGVIQGIIIIDDASSATDRAAMLRALPEAVFVAKDALSRGHANSLNSAFPLVRTRFLLYLEDDWKLLSKPLMTPPLRESLESIANLSNKFEKKKEENDDIFSFHVLVEAAVGVILSSIASKEPVAQVLFNDQVTNECARVANDCARVA